MALICLILFTVILVMLIVMTYRVHAMLHTQPIAAKDELNIEKTGLIQGWIYAAIIFTIIVIITSVWFMVKDTPYEGHLMEWLNIVVRVMHITFGIAWIGASFYFVWLENALNRTQNVRDELAGNLWAVHGGGFYYLEKYKVAPKTIPKDLHWFKYEAYFTWVSGFALLFIIYYFNAQAMLVDSNVMKLSSAAAISIGIGSFVVAWVLYDLMCKSALKNISWAFSCIGLLILIGFAY